MAIETQRLVDNNNNDETSTTTTENNDESSNDDGWTASIDVRRQQRLQLVDTDSEDESNKTKKSKKSKERKKKCTLGYAMRAVLRHVHCHHYDGNSEAVVASVQCNFTKPVFVGDAIRVDVWDEEDECTSQEKSVINIYFFVHKALSGGCENNEMTSVVVLDKGIAKFRLLKRPGAEVAPTISRL